MDQAKSAENQVQWRRVPKIKFAQNIPKYLLVLDFLKFNEIFEIRKSPSLITSKQATNAQIPL